MAVLEHALLPVRAGCEAGFEAAMADARPLIEASPGFISLEIRRPVATGQAYLLLVKWRSVEDHRDGFRQSDRYRQWRALLHHFYDPMPEVGYFGDPL
ncbi:antibiotic biosynthesis monooxygenase family protein [Sphingopyxis macrogoltabida]|uniref:Antibiotic biosynthesis monooxygenase n=1 Tax=Sphingopyxis macrogoltabida TaxID=33050 RepID=A0AAC9AYG0_SPHMC|nr:antibiotic biosynthesis monooxygenase [Sphingopyxis macrogoltabida]ALJ15938.1 antibiotic biosynthesis monooxygenase [Sphingopyxis macrogoltabida]AMU92178.1 antibiotic biosynthesis monooxygenase [Sphingopyxis macrogoltabida]